MTGPSICDWPATPLMKLVQSGLMSLRSSFGIIKTSPTTAEIHRIDRHTQPFQEDLRGAVDIIFHTWKYLKCDGLMHTTYPIEYASYVGPKSALWNLIPPLEFMKWLFKIIDPRILSSLNAATEPFCWIAQCCKSGSWQIHPSIPWWSPPDFPSCFQFFRAFGDWCVYLVENKKFGP